MGLIRRVRCHRFPVILSLRTRSLCFFLGALLFAVYLVGTFGSALSIIYAWNASNTSGHTKKGSAPFDQIASVFIEFPSNDQRDDSGSFCSW